MTQQERSTISDAWLTTGEDALASAHELRSSGRYRSSVSRSYYAAYSFLASSLVLVSGVNFRDDREGPEHEPLSDLVKVHLFQNFGGTLVKSMRQAIQVLYEARLLADYRPREAIRERVATEALQRATFIANNVKNRRP